MKFTQYDEVTQPNPQGFLLIAELQPDDTFITKKVTPDNLGAQGPVGPQGLPGPMGAGVAGPQGNPGVPGATGATGAAGTPGTNGTNGTNGSNEISNLDGWALDTFEDSAVVATQLARTTVGWSGAFLANGASIVSRSLVLGTEQRLSISSGEIIRQFGWSSRWNKIQIGLSLRINGVATFPGEYFIGVCSGTTAGYGSAGCVNAAGISSRPPNGNAFTFGASPNALINQFVTTFVGFESKIGAVLSNQIGGSGSAGRHFTATESWRSFMFIQIERPVAATTGTSVTYTFTVSMTGPTSVEYDIAQRQLFNLGPDTTNIGLLSVTSQTGSFSYDESTGILDSLNIYWPNATPLEISAMSVRKIF